MIPERKAARELIAFYLDAGVDAFLGEEPINRMADDLSRPLNAIAAALEPRTRRPASESPPALAQSPLRQKPTPGSSPPPPEAAVMAAREAARNAKTLDELQALLATFEGCALRATATQLVFADGDPQSRVMFVGEAPGYDEDIVGRPFIGRSGKLLDRMMAAIGLDRTSAYIANVVPWRPPGNRTPTPQETAICLPFIRRQIELANPRVLVCLGNSSAQTLLGLKEGITRTRGQQFDYPLGEGGAIKAMPMLHPAYLLRQPAQKRLAWKDLQKLSELIARTDPAANS
jgi:uracil-DNA glycosylase family 4